ncbi:CsbD family protein [Sphingomonas morindae]|uniref:CsbD family protein n=1 Tax=Sphingomonas morindae TaxID=1541170 RepID=A0ABY4X6M9_9SPHN|nr:CsbD family protein [Sphingomonas morindae]USI72578.1 CsbD family protein [Sphingomonas morindae]
MNKNELHGNARYVGGKVEKAIGDAVESRDWQVDGVVDQVAGSAEHLYGRARTVAKDALDSAPALVDSAKERLESAADAVRDGAKRGGRLAQERLGDTQVAWLIGAAALGGYALSWLVHGRRA